MNTNQCDVAKIDREILRPFHHIRQAASNTVVGYDIPAAFNYWFKVPSKTLEEIQDIADTFYNATFLIDDIQDNSRMRRRIPAAHIIFGLPLTINACIQMYTQVINRISKLDHPKALETFLDLAEILIRGQGADIYMRENLIILSEDDYKWISSNLKAAQSISLPLRLLQLFSEDKRDYSKLINLFGVYYEIRDDYCNLMKQERLDGKSKEKQLRVMNEHGFCEDFTDGKFSFPVLHALRTSPDASPLIYALKQRTQDYEVKKYVLSILQKLGSLEYTLSVLRAMEKEIRNEVRRLGGNPVFEAILDDLSI